jgi:glycosyltransferase involved in cell wall biosynthesis
MRATVRIAFMSTPFIRVPPVGYGGTELFCWELAEELSARGHEVTLFTTGDSVTSCEKRHLYAVPEWPPSPYDDLSHIAWSMGEVVRGDFDVVHVNSPFALPFARFVEVPFVYTLHHHREEAMSRLYAANQRAAFVAISRRQLELEVPLTDATVIHHGLDADRYPPSDRDEGYLLHLGRYSAQKGTATAIDVATRARMPLKLAGRTHPEDASYVAAEVAPRLSRPNVEEVGEAAHAKKLALLRGARAMLLPLAWEEPFGLVAVEAMLAGTPVIGFARGSFPEIIEEGVTGFLAPPGDVEALAALATRLEGFDRRACARRARERFTTQVMTDAYERVYARVASRRARPEMARARRSLTGLAPSRRSSSGR